MHGGGGGGGVAGTLKSDAIDVARELAQNKRTGKSAEPKGETEIGAT